LLIILEVAMKKAPKILRVKKCFITSLLQQFWKWGVEVEYYKLIYGE